MARLKDRQHQIPGGFQFRIPQLKFRTTPFSSFDVVCSAVLRIVKANPGLAEKNKWPTTRAGVEDWVDNVNAEICKLNGWGDYITEAPPPKTAAPAADRRLQSVAGAVKKINSGAMLLLDWEKSGVPPVDARVSEWRADICAACPKNGKGDVTSWFTVPASELIRKQIGRLNGLKLSTSKDGVLGICQACLCPLKLKVHTPLDLVLKHLSEDAKSDLPANCWILKA